MKTAYRHHRDEDLGRLYRIYQERIDHGAGKTGGRRLTPVNAFTLLKLPVRHRQFFGEWLNVAWEKKHQNKTKTGM